MLLLRSMKWALYLYWLALIVYCLFHGIINIVAILSVHTELLHFIGEKIEYHILLWFERISWIMKDVSYRLFHLIIYYPPVILDVHTHNTHVSVICILYRYVMLLSLWCHFHNCSGSLDVTSAMNRFWGLDLLVLFIEFENKME